MQAPEEPDDVTPGSAGIGRRISNHIYAPVMTDQVFTMLMLSMSPAVLRCSQDVVRLRATLPDGSPADRRGWPAALSSQDNPFEAMVRVSIRVRFWV